MPPALQQCLPLKWCTLVWHVSTRGVAQPCELPDFAKCKGGVTEDTALSKVRQMWLAWRQLASPPLCQAKRCLLPPLARQGSSGSQLQRNGHKAAMQVKWEDV